MSGEAKDSGGGGGDVTKGSFSGPPDVPRGDAPRWAIDPLSGKQVESQRGAGTPEPGGEPGGEPEKINEFTEVGGQEQVRGLSVRVTITPRREVVDVRALARLFAQLDVLYTEGGRAWIENRAQDDAALPADTDVGSPVVRRVHMGSPLAIELFGNPTEVGAEAMALTVYLLMHLNQILDSLGSSVNRFKEARDEARRRAAQAHVRAEFAKREARMIEAALGVNDFARSMQLSSPEPDYAPGLASFLQQAVERQISKTFSLLQHDASGTNVAEPDLTGLQAVEDASGLSDTMSEPTAAAYQSASRRLLETDDGTLGPAHDASSRADGGGAWLAISLGRCCLDDRVTPTPAKWRRQCAGLRPR